ncbi:group I intron-associated PD-(D/E)XK endonuclease [Halopenitus persicus]|uniref:group I intron-associated PD-(D/E)XK endonuclease n=1 Tax=Halopenitus persicus TaxID=1048396 RepID=UPI000BBA68AE|nr:group I intron-associated PD-(D/E)XK endonuclease [Halopenitus persicus]
MAEARGASSNRAGEVAENIVSTKLLRLGYNVAEPRIPCPYDVIADLDDQLVKVQVKRGFDDSSRDETLRVNLLGSIHKGGTEYKSVKYQPDEVDSFAIYDPIQDEVYWLWFDEAPSTELRRKYTSLRRHRIEQKL